MNQAIKVAKEESKKIDLYRYHDKPSILAMDKGNFNYQKELKALFAKTANAAGATFGMS